MELQVSRVEFLPSEFSCSEHSVQVSFYSSIGKEVLTFQFLCVIALLILLCSYGLIFQVPFPLAINSDRKMELF